MATPPEACPECGAPLDPGGAGGCANCLYQLAVDVGVADRAHITGLTPPDPQRLASLLPDFELLETLGHGGMGAVYRVRQTRLHREAALKVLPPERASDPEFVERFFREAQALAHLSHPNIVSVYDMGQRGPFLYILMEHVDGRSLREVIREDGLAPADAIRIVTALCGALEYAHEQGVVHRDIKPENVLIATDGRVKLVDFGLVKMACDSGVDQFTLTDINLRMGTPAYMAPEQTAGSPGLDHRVDIYALGVLLYEMLTGEPPVLDYTPPSRRAAVDPRIDRVVHHAIRESPQERFQSAAELRKQLEHIVRTPRRRRLLLGGGLAAILLLGALGGAIWRFGATPDTAPLPGAPVDGVPIAAAPFTADEARAHQQRWADHLGIPVEWTNSIGMEFILIPPGEYTRGYLPENYPPELINPEEATADPSHVIILQSCVPAHRVRLTQPFYLAKTEVTQRQFEQVMGYEVGYFRTGMPGEAVLDTLDTDDLPAENLGWSMAVDFCERLSEREAFGDPDARYRLPTDAEWAFAIRAGTTMRFWHGEDLDTRGVYEVSSDMAGGHPHPVASGRPNPFGLYDMGGNVAEYCSDWWAPDEFQRYADRAAVDPMGPEDGVPGGLMRVVRGGHFSVRPTDHESTKRTRHDPTLWDSTVGFRVAIPAEAVAQEPVGTAGWAE